MSLTLPEWVDQVCRELDLGEAVAAKAATGTVLDLARDVAHGVARPAAPVTAFLLGVAAGRAEDPKAALAGLAEQVRGLLPADS